MKDRLEQARAAALADAELELEQLGLTRTADGSWSGGLRDSSGTEQPCRVALPAEFPDRAPEIFLTSAQNVRLAHVERTGKICIAPSTGVLLDATRPRQLVRDAVARAGDVLLLPGPRHEEDRLSEFSAYWASNADSLPYHSICDVPFQAGPVVIYEVFGARGLIADSESRGHQWLERTGKKIKGSREAYALALAVPWEPPGFGDIVTLQDARDLLRDRCAGPSFDGFWEWLKGRGLPATVVLSQVLPHGATVLFALELPPPPSGYEKVWRNGFRPGKERRELQLPYAFGQECERALVRRIDQPFLLERVGGNSSMLGRTVAVVGCGAVGSHVAMALAGSGIGKLHLIDKERLEPENQHRHVLGAAYVGLPKVEGLKCEIGRRFPEVEVTTDFREILDVFGDPAGIARILSSSLVVFAIGDETLELRLNQLSQRSIPRVHAWLEPRGLGGHVLQTGAPDSTGCYACMFRTDGTYGLVNQSAMAAPGQTLQATLEGCSGVFTPFGLADAQRAGVEAARVVVDALEGVAARTSRLLTWQTSRTGFVAAGGLLSIRGERIAEGASVMQQVGPRGCSVCGNWAQ